MMIEIEFEVSICSIKCLFVFQFAIDAPRIHPLLFDQHVEFEKGFPASMIAALQAKDHNMTLKNSVTPSSAISAVGRRGDTLQAYSDYRRLGVIAGY